MNFVEMLAPEVWLSANGRPRICPAASSAPSKVRNFCLGPCRLNERWPNHRLVSRYNSQGCGNLADAGLIEQRQGSERRWPQFGGLNRARGLTSFSEDIARRGMSVVDLAFTGRVFRLSEETTLGLGAVDSVAAAAFVCERDTYGDRAGGSTTSS